MFGSSYKCNDYSIKVFKDKLKISIYGTYVENVIERPIDEKFVLDYMKRHNCEAFINHLLNDDLTLTPLELRLSMCYRLIIFVKNE